jgi:ABC-type uncharacterized transport system substrate-binding protein
MRRRSFIVGIGAAAVTSPRAARAQSKGELRRIGILMGTAESDPYQLALVAALVETLSGLGWKESQTARIVYRWANGDADRLDAAASELARFQPEVAFAQGTPATMAFHRVAPAIPTVFANLTDPVATGLVTNLARPGGNVTGFVSFEKTLGGKWLGLLKELSPGLKRVAMLLHPENPGAAAEVQSVNDAAATAGVTLTIAPVHDTSEIERAVADFARGTDGGLVIMGDFLTVTYRDVVVRLAAQHKLPAVYSTRAFMASGGLAAYGPDATDLFRRAGAYIDRILRGAQAGDLPVQQPTKYELLINLNAAKALGLDLSPNLLAQADEVIE